VRLKVDAPVSENENVSINFQDNLKHIAKVIWVSEDYVGSYYFDAFTYDLSLHGAKIK
jgi:hypothetical protein